MQRLKFHLGIVLSVIVLMALLSSCGQLDWPFGKLLYDVSLTPDAISPNADGERDATSISYSLRRAASVDIYFDDPSGVRFYFRQGERRAPDRYNVLWGGVINSVQAIKNEFGKQTLLGHVLPDGIYTWTISASDDAGENEIAQGSITLVDGDSDVPQLQNFAVVPTLFQPNQDGIADRVSINYFLTQDVDEVFLYLTKPNDPTVRFPIGGDFNLQDPKKQGGFSFSYDGGVDLNAEPPPDGDYVVIAEARDLAGNAVRVEQSLTISEGGKPRADVLGGEIDWFTVFADGSNQQVETNRQLSIPPDGKLCFAAVIVNEGAVPIRTAGPWSGQEYQLGDNRNTLAQQRFDETGNKDWFQQAGVFRFGINFDDTGIDYPFRWALGRQEQLERRLVDGDEQWYLLPGKRSKVAGCIGFEQQAVTDVLPSTDTIWWGGLIHESVAIANNNVDRITVRSEKP